MNAVTVLFFAFSLVVSAIFESMGLPEKCLPGDKHKKFPSEEESMSACKAYKDASCCTSDFTKQLATSPIKKIDNFYWAPCNNTLSAKCEAFLVMVECFYRCSHNAVFWKNRKYPSALLEAPICASFCDDWFDACKDDLTCAKNWLTDFNTTTGINTCKQPCKNFSDYYTDGKDLCEGMWGQTFVYKETNCLQLNFTGNNPNDKVVEKLFGSGEKGNKTANGVFAPSVCLVMVWISSLFAITLFY